MRTGKSVFALVMLLAALAGGWFLSNYLIQFILGLHDSPWAWNTWWLYYQAIEFPKFAPYAVKIKLSGVIGFGLPLLAWLALLIPLFKESAESLHGDASFAELADLKRAGLLQQTPQSILLGKYKGRYLWLGGAQHVITISPTRSGKTTSIAIPVLLSYLQSMIVLDLKGELHKATSGWREAQGQRIRVWATRPTFGASTTSSLSRAGPVFPAWASSARKGHRRVRATGTTCCTPRPAWLTS